jgi:hypothetical protein
MNNTITVKSIGSPPTGAHWNMGAEYMTRISAHDARLLALTQLPRMGYECDVRTVRPVQWPHLPLILTLQNLSGHYYLCSPHARIDQWPDVFGVSVTGHDKEQA